MKFLVDNQLSVFLAKELRKLGYDAIHVTEVDMGSSDDIDILDFAEHQGRIIITADNDFPHMMATMRKKSPSIILFRLNQLYLPSDQMVKLAANLEILAQSLTQGCIVTFKGQSVRLRLLPIYPPVKDEL